MEEDLDHQPEIESPNRKKGALSGKKLWKIPVILLGLALAFFLLQVVRHTIPRILHPHADTQFPQTLSEQKEYVYNYLKSKSKELVYVGYDKPSADELAGKKDRLDLTSRYPDYIKGVFDPGGESNTVNLTLFSDELIDLGINTYFVIGEYQINNGKAEIFQPYRSKNGSPSELSAEEAKLILADRILMAKDLGLSVILVPDYPDAFGVGRNNYDIDSIDPELKRVALELAQIAQDYGADYLAPVNEYEHLLYSNGYSIEEIKVLFKDFYADLIPQIREVYGGKIIIKCGNVGDWSNFTELSMEGADLFGVGNAYAAREGEVADDVSQMSLAATQVSQRDNVPWFISEFLVFNSDDQVEMFGEVKSEITTARAYEEGIEAFMKDGGAASGFTFMGWTGTGNVRRTEAVKYIEQLFKNK